MLGFLNLDGALEVYILRFGELPLSAKRQNIEKTNVNKMSDI